MHEEKKVVNIGIVENDSSYREQIIKVLEALPQIGSLLHWESAEAFLQDKKGRGLDIILLDIMLPGMSGVELAAKLSEREPETNKIMLSNMNSDELIFKSLGYGAIGYILKSELKDIADIIDIVLRGGAIITPTIAFRVLNSFKRIESSSEVKLTKKENKS